MLLHQFYWKAFTGNDAAERPNSDVKPELGPDEEPA
jgi:hypothetical protein